MLETKDDTSRCGKWNDKVNNLITSVQHPDVKLVKALSRRKERKEYGLFVIEGLRFVEEAVGAGAPLVKVYFTKQFLQSERGTELVEKLIGQGVIVQEVSLPVLGKMTDTEQPQGILATVRLSAPALTDFSRAQTFILVCDRIQDPGNMGTIIRTADAAGVQTIFTTIGTVDVYNPKVLRSTMGSIFHVPIFTELTADNVIEILAERGVTPIGTALSAEQAYFTTNFDRPIALWLGSEAAGIEDSVIKKLPELIKIPMPGRAESLNVAVAAGILMFECVRQRSSPSSLKA